MKQRITVEQLNELVDGGKERIRKFWYSTNPGLSDMYVVLVKYDDVTRYEGPYLNTGHRNFLEDYYTGEALPLLSIGQMIELLKDEIDNIDFSLPNESKRHYSEGFIVRTFTKSYESKELCDALWEACKEILAR